MTPMPDKVIKSRPVIDVLDDLGAHHNVSLVCQARDLSWRRKQIDLMKCRGRNLGARDTYPDLTEFEADASAHAP